MTSAPDIAIALDHVSVAYHGDITILNDISLAFRRGIVSGVIGPNGAGKSTVLKTMFGFLKPHRGQVVMDGRAITGLEPFQRAELGISFLPQSRGVFADLSVEDNILLGCWTIRRDKARLRRALDMTFERFPMLAERRRDRAGTLSGGQQRFLELARTLALAPKIVLLDEPTAMIAPKFSAEIYAFIRTLSAAGVTVILIDQNVRQCAAVSDYLFVLELGRNKAEGDRSAFSGNSQLRDIIAGWLDYRVH